GRQNAGAVRTRTAAADPLTPDHHPAGSRRHLRPHGGPHLPRRVIARSVFHHASITRLGALPYADQESVFMRQRHTSRRRFDWRVRRQRRPRNLEALEEMNSSPVGSGHSCPPTVTAHLGTAALGCPVERSSTENQRSARREGYGISRAERPHSHTSF